MSDLRIRCTDPVLPEAVAAWQDRGMTKTEEKWAERVREWKDSGKLAEAFTKGQPYKASTLRWWAAELRRRGERGGLQAAAPRNPSVVSIPMARVLRRRRLGAADGVAGAVGAVAKAVVVEVAGARIPLSPGFDPELLSDVVRALAGAR